MGVLSLTGAGAQNRLLSSFWDYGRYRLKLYATYTERWQWRDGIIKSVADHPVLDGYGLTSATAKYEEGFATFVWQYETATESGATFGYGERNGGKTYLYEGSLSKSPITMHQKIGKWLGYKNPVTGKRYGRVVGGEVIWELEDPTDSQARTGLTPTGTVSNNINPFYGVSDFYDVSAVSIVETVRSKSDLEGILDGLGTISSPAGSKEKPGDGFRNWIYAGASAQQVGNKFLVRRSWMLSGPGGWEPALYDAKYWSKKEKKG